MGRFCSSENHPMNLVTSDNHAFIRMNTDDSQANRGFYLKYKTLCNRTISATSGVIESPNFPDQYPINVDCAWTIVVPKGNKIHMQFSHFELENEGQKNGTSVSDQIVDRRCVTTFFHRFSLLFIHSNVARATSVSTTMLKFMILTSRIRWKEVRS